MKQLCFLHPGHTAPPHTGHRNIATLSTQQSLQPNCAPWTASTFISVRTTNIFCRNNLDDIWKPRSEKVATPFHHGGKFVAGAPVRSFRDSLRSAITTRSRSQVEDIVQWSIDTNMSQNQNHHDDIRINNHPTASESNKSQIVSRTRNEENSKSINTNAQLVHPLNAKRWSIIALLAAAFVLANMDKVNMSVACVVIADQWMWSDADKGLVSASFFWGYTLSQTPAGILVTKLGGINVMLAGVVLWSLATVAVPLVAQNGILALCFVRFLTGLGEGLAPASAANIIAKIIPQAYRARAVTLVWGGLDMGSVTGFLIAGAMISGLGWETIFYTFGAMGLAWCGVAYLSNTKHVVDQLSLDGTSSVNPMNGQAKSAKVVVPWKEIARFTPMYALSTAHFCYNYAYYVILAWLPSYFDKALGMDITRSSFFTLLPYLSMLLTTPIVGPTADILVNRGWRVTHVRKLAQGISFVVPAICLSALALIQPTDPYVPLALFAVLGSAMSWARGGLYCNHQDISPRYAGALLGITNTAGAIPGILGVWFVGCQLDKTGGDWNSAFLGPIILFQFIGLAVYTLYGSSDKAKWG